MTWNLRREEEESIFRKRLLHDGHGSGEDKRLVNIIRNVTKLAIVPMESTDPSDDLTKLTNVIYKDLSTAIHAADRHEKMREMHERTFKDVEKSIQDMSSRIEEGRSKIDRLKLELEFVERLRQIEHYPDCITSEQEMKELEMRKRKFHDRIEKQKMNMTLLVEACKSLQKVLEYAERDIILTATTNIDNVENMALSNHNQN